MEGILSPDVIRSIGRHPPRSSLIEGSALPGRFSITA